MTVEKLSPFETYPTPVDYSYRLSRSFFIATENCFPGSDEYRRRASALLLQEEDEIKKLDDLEKRAGFYLDAAVIKLFLGEDPTILIEKAVKYAPKKRSIDHDFISPRASLIAAHAGDYEMALELAERGCRDTSIWPLRQTTDLVHRLGGDYQPFLESYLKALETYKSWYKDPHHRHTIGLLAWAYVGAANLMIKLDEEPTPFLEKAEKILEEAKPSSHWAYHELVYPYALQGDIAKAKSFVEKIECEKSENTALEKKAALGQIARIQAKQEDFEGANITAQECGVPIVTTDVLLSQAHHLAKEGKDPTRILEEAITMAINIPDNTFTFSNSCSNEPGQATVCARAGRIQVIAGNDPKKYFDRALAIVDVIKTAGLKIESLTEIAKTMRAVGVDSRHLFRQALDLFTDNQSWLYLSDLLSIHRLALESGYGEFIEEIMKKLTDIEAENEYSPTWRHKFVLQTLLSYARWGNIEQN